MVRLLLLLLGRRFSEFIAAAIAAAAAVVLLLLLGICQQRARSSMPLSTARAFALLLPFFL